MIQTNFKAAIWKEDTQYVAQCLNLDIASFGSTKKEALQNLQEAILLYLEEAKEPKVTKVLRPDLVSFQLSYA